MKLRHQSMWALLLTTVITTLALFLVLRAILEDTFMDLEIGRAAANMKRVMAAIDHDMDNLDATVNDWAAWDEAYDFIYSRDEDFINTNIIISTFEALRLNLIMFVDKHSRIVAQAAYDLENKEFTKIPPEIRAQVEYGKKLVNHQSVKDYVKGFIRVDQRAMLAASRPVVTGQHKGPIRGSVIMGRYLTNQEIAALGKRLGLQLHMDVIDRRDTSGLMVGECYEAADGLRICLRENARNLISALAPIKDINGRDLILAKIDQPMTIMSKGRATLLYYTGALVSFALLFLLISSAFIGRSEKSLIANEQKYRNLVEYSPAVVALVEGERITYANKTLSDLLGFESPSGIEGLNFFELADPDFREVVEFQFKLASMNKRVLPFSEHRMRAKDGSVVYLEATVIPMDLSGSRGAPAVKQYVAIDATEKREAQVALMESEKRYRSVVEDQTELICRHNPDGALTFVNEAYCRYFGKSRQELMSASIYDFIPEEDKRIVRLYLDSLTPGCNTGAFAHRVISKSGDMLWQEWTNRAIFDKDRNVVEFQGVGRDITHLRQAYQDLQAGRQRLSYLLSSSPAVIYTCKPTGDFAATFISENVTSQTGWSPEDFTESPSFWLDHIHPDDIDRALQNSRQIVERGWLSHEYRFLAKWGDYLWMRDELIVARDENGKPKELIGSWIDITDRRIAEEKMRASLKEKEVLLQEIHHRVKNNLQIMSSLIDLQSYEISDPKDAALFQDAQGRIWSMALAHEKLYESENLSEIRMDEYILDLATDVVISYSTEYKKIQVVSHVDPVRLGIDMAVPCGLILYELISNSVKHAFNDSESGIITVTFKREENSVLNLTVRDNGAGMDDHIDLSQMTSFGLRLVNNLVMQLDGAITLTDSQGAVVEIKIPAIGVI